jgi:hypothetical protein
MDSMTITQGEQVFGHDGMLWKPLPGCVSTFDELLHSQRRWMQIFNETDWDPWRAAELAPECKHAEHVMGEWTRAEPGHRPMTKRRIGAINAAITRKVRAERAADEARWERDRSRYDLERERARLALLERDSIHRSHERELAEHRSRTIYPAMPAARRAEAIAELEAKVEKDEQEIARLATVVGDREDVVDHDGKLPHLVRHHAPSISRGAVRVHRAAARSARGNRGPARKVEAERPALHGRSQAASAPGCADPGGRRYVRRLLHAAVPTWVR